jgi:signal transduction histidine kinase
LVAAAFAVTAVTGFLERADPERLLTRGMILTELAVGFALGAGDDWAFAGDHPQSLGSVWPLAGVLTAGVLWAGRGGAIAGAVVGLGGLFGDLVEASNPGDTTKATTPITELSENLSSAITGSSTVVLYALAGGVAGFAVVKLREAERRISLAQAREEVARTLHDGVLQTLAVVQRRSGDPDLARLARDQERELREYLFGAEPAGGELGPRLRQAAARFEDHFEGARAQVIVADDLPKLTDERVEALAGAVSEALANAGKHGGARSVTVYAEPDEDGHVFCSVKDDGTGFEEHAVEGVGLTRSIRGRVADVGGRVEVDGNPGRGTEVRLWV